MLLKKGFKSLLIDADAQGNSTDTYKALINGQATLYDVLLDEDRIRLEDAIQNTEAGYIVASDPLLRKSDEILDGSIDGLYRLQDSVASLSGWNYIIVDTAPSIGRLLYNCLIAADLYGLQGLSQLNQTTQAMQKCQNKDLKIAGLLLVKFNPRTNLSKEVKSSLKDIAHQMDTILFDTFIRESTKARKTQATRIPRNWPDTKAVIMM